MLVSEQYFTEQYQPDAEGGVVTSQHGESQTSLLTSFQSEWRLNKSLLSLNIASRTDQISPRR